MSRFASVGIAIFAAGIPLAGCNSPAGNDTKAEAPATTANATANETAAAGNQSLVAARGARDTRLVPCVVAEGSEPVACRAWTVRNQDGTSVVTIIWPDGRTRAIFFDADEDPTGSDAGQAGAAAGQDVVATRQGETVVLTIGPERYELEGALIGAD